VSEPELILLDFALAKAPIGNTFRVHGLLYNASVGLQERYSEEIVKEVNRILISRSDAIRNLLLTEEYIEVVDPSTHLDKLTPTGKKAKELGGHKQYLEWEVKDIRRKNIEEWPKKKWYLYDPIKYLFFFALGWVLNYLICTVPIKNENRQNQNQDTIKQTKPSQPLPKSSGKKDSP
jgi:hypothetical protein